MADRRVVLDGLKRLLTELKSMSKPDISTDQHGNPTATMVRLNAADLDGTNRKTIVPQAQPSLPKQLKLDSRRQDLLSDREGMRVMRANFNGSEIETLVDTSEGETRLAAMLRNVRWNRVDRDGGKVY